MGTDRRAQPAARRLGGCAAEAVIDNRDGGRVAATGAAGGLASSWILVAVVRHIDPAFGVPALWTWLACPLVLGAVVVVAGIFPARWALAVDPLTRTREG